MRLILCIGLMGPLVGFCPGPRTRPGVPGFIQLDAGRREFCGIDSAGALRCTSTVHDAPMQYTLVSLPGGARARATALGADHACALTLEGRAYCWGKGSYGQLGSGLRTDSDVPVEVRAPEKFKEVSAGGTHTCAIGVSGALYCWGGNWHGQLGIGTLSNSATPVLVDSGTVYTHVSTGGIHTCAVTRGTVRCWGDQRSGRLGLGHIPPQEVTAPQTIVSGTRFTEVSAGNWHSCGLRTNGRVVCWGGGESGAGTDTIGIPYDVGLRGIRKIAAGPRHTCAMDRTGAVWCWGALYGRDAVTAAPSAKIAPARVPLRMPARAIAVGGDDFSGFSCAVDVRGDVRCWDVGQR